MPLESVPVDYLFTIRAQTVRGAPVADGPQGARNIVPVTGGTFEGPRLKGTIEQPAGDWVTRRADGSAKLDVRLTLKTEDGAVILMAYNGILQVNDGIAKIRSAPLFETGDERYTWLNRVQAVGIGTPVQGGVEYDIYAVL